MTSRSRAAHGIWRTRHVRSAGERLYVIYAGLLVLVIAVAPMVRAVWLSATSTAGVALFASPAAPAMAVLVTAVLWASGLLLGRDRGPAVLPPFLTHALATSDLPRSRVLSSPMLRAGAIVIMLTTVAATLVSAGLASHGLISGLGLSMFVVTGTLVGAITTVLWLAGQTFPRAAIPIALGVVACGILVAVAPAVQPFMPWGWVGLAYPVSGAAVPAVTGLAVVTVALLALVPALLNRLHLAELMAQATRWQSASTFAAGLDLGAAAATYQRRPYLGRRIRAVRPHRSLPVTFLIRDAIGAIRTPGRLIVGVLVLAAGGTLLATAFAPAAPGWLLGAVAGLFVFAGLGPLTDGIRHAASVAADLPLYGISDGHLLALHAIFPVALFAVVLLVAVLVCSTSIGTGLVTPIISSLMLGFLGLLARVNNALKGPMPTWLLTPVMTPVGDLSPAVRVIWAHDGVLLAAAAGAAAALVAGSPQLLVVTGAILLGVGINRWRHRG